MAKKITQPQSNSLNTQSQTNTQPLTVNLNHQIQTINTTSQIKENNTIPNQSIFQNQKIVSSIKQQPQQSKNTSYYRITSYPIDNKTYRLISLNEENQDESEQSDELNQNDGNANDDFRQPLVFPRFNFFTGWSRNPLNNSRRRQPNNRRIYPFRNRKSYLQSAITFVKKVYFYAKSVQISTLYEYIPFYCHPPTLESKYKYVSLAILNNSINLQAAIIKALEYNIPLMQIIMNPNNLAQERIVVDKILKDFTIGHFINQNFVLYGDWNYKKYKQIFSKNFEQQQNHFEQQQVPQKYAQNGKILFRKGQIVFAEIDLPYVDSIDHNQLQQKLQQIRNHYYRQKQLYRNPNSIISQSSNFQINRSSISSQQSQQNRKQGNKKSVKQVQQEILRDYLQQKMQQQILQRQRQQCYSDEQQIQSEQYVDQYSSFYRSNNSSHQNSQVSSLRNSRKQQKIKHNKQKQQTNNKIKQEDNQEQQYQQQSQH